MNGTLIINLLRFIFLILFQVLIFNNFNLFGFLNPFPYILFILLYPANGSKTNLLIASFFLGLVMDIFCNSGGVHAASCVVLAYARHSIFKFSFGLSYEYQTVKINANLTKERLSFIFISILLHHLVMYILEVFSWGLVFDILVRTILSTLFTLLMSILIIYTFKPSSK